MDESVLNQSTDQREIRRSSARNFFHRFINRFRHSSSSPPSSSTTTTHPFPSSFSSECHADSVEDSDRAPTPVRTSPLHSPAYLSGSSPHPPDQPIARSSSGIPVHLCQFSGPSSSSSPPPPLPRDVHSDRIPPAPSRTLPPVVDNLHKNVFGTVNPEPAFPEDPANSPPIDNTPPHHAPRQQLFQFEGAASQYSEEDDYVSLQFRPPPQQQQQQRAVCPTINDISNCKIYKNALISSHLQLLKTEAAHQRKIAQLTTLLRDTSSHRNKYEKLVFEKSARGEQARDVHKGKLQHHYDDIVIGKVSSAAKKGKDIQRGTEKRSLEDAKGENKTQQLFGQVFPFVKKWLSRNDMLACRQVCQTWGSGVDSYFESHNIVALSDPLGESPRQGGMEGGLRTQHCIKDQQYFDYIFTIPTPLMEDLFDTYRLRYKAAAMKIPGDRILLQLKHHERTRNPFIGRTVSLHEHVSPSRYLNVIDNFTSAAAGFLEIFGHHIWHLTIYCEEVGQSPYDLYRVVHQAVAQCENLRSLSLRGEFCWSGDDAYQIQKINECSLVERPSLETLILEINQSLFSLIQDKLFQKYSSQLKRLEVEIWKEDFYSSLSWSHLLHLEISSKTLKIFPCLNPIKAPLLRILSIPLATKESDLTALLQLISHFPKLTHLKIDFEHPCPPFLSLDDMLSPPGSPTCSSHLTVLELTSGAGSNISHDFLIYFPFLRKLILRRVLCPLEFLETELNPAEAFFLMMESDFWIKHDALKQNELVKLVRHLKIPEIELTPGTSLYQSDIWLFLPFLQILEVRNAQFDPEKGRVFTREGYDVHWGL